MFIYGLRYYKRSAIKHGSVRVCYFDFKVFVFRIFGLRFSGLCFPNYPDEQTNKAQINQITLVSSLAGH